MRKGVTFLATLILAGSMALPSAAQDAPSSDTVVATVNGTDITLGHVIVAFASLPQQYQQIPPSELFPGIVTQLIQQTALAQSFTGEISTATRLSLDNEERSLMAAEAVEVVMRDSVTDEQVKAAYDEQYASGNAGEEYNASHILVATEEEALALVQELADGADFATLAMEKSTGPSGPSGGELGWFGSGMMVPDFEAAVIALEVGNVSQPVETQFGWHVIKLNDSRVIDAPALDDVRDEILLELQQASVTVHIGELVDAAEVDRLDLTDFDVNQISNFDLLRN